MKTKFYKRLLLGTLTATLLAVSCKEPEPVPPRGEYDGGYFVLNEGQFMHDNASISFIKEDFSLKEDSVFYKANDGMPIGDVAQSLFLNDDKAYIVVNNSHKIIVADRWNMQRKSEIVALIKSPREIVKFSDRYALVSNWGEVFDSNWSDVEDDYVAWLDLENDVIIDTMHVGLGPTYMTFVGGNVYLSLSGVSASNNKVAVIDPAGKSLITEIEVGDRPGRIVTDDDGYVWVLCSGNPSWTGNETAGHLIKIDPSVNQVVADLSFGVSEHPQYLTFDGDTDQLYYILNGKVYALPVNATSLPATAFIDLSGEVAIPYGMDYHDGKLFVTDAVDYTNPGKVVIYDTNGGQKIASYTTGLLPNSVKYNKWEY